MSAVSAAAGLPLIRVLALSLALALALAVAVPGGVVRAAGFDAAGGFVPGEGEVPLSGPAVGDGAAGAGNNGSAGRDAFLVNDLARRQAESLDTGRVGNLLEDLNRETGPYLPPLRLDRAWRPGETGKGLTPGSLASGLVRMLMREVVANVGLLAKLVVLAALASVLYHLQSALGDATVARAAYGAVFLALVGLALASFYLAVQVAQGAVERLTTFMLAVLPLLITLLAGSGALVSAGFFHPFVVAVVHFTGLLVSHWVFPLLFLAAVLYAVTGFSEHVQLTGLAGLLRQAGMVALGLGLAAFLGVMTVQGAAAAVGDGASMRAVKFLAKAFVPGVGGMFSDAAELVATSSLLLRNGVGVVGLLAVLFIAVMPIVKLISLVLVYRLAAAAVQPVGVEGLGACLEGLAGNLVLVTVAVGAVAVMFFLALGALVGAGNAALMFR